MELTRAFITIIFLVLSSSFVLSGKVLPGCCQDHEECERWSQVWQTDRPIKIIPTSFSCLDPVVHVVGISKEFKDAFHNKTSFRGVIHGYETPSDIKFNEDGSIQFSAFKNSYVDDFHNDSFCISSPPDALDQLVQVDLCLTGHSWYKKCCPPGQHFLMNGSHGECIEPPVHSMIQFPPSDESKRLYPVAEIPVSVNCIPQYISTALGYLDFNIIPWKMDHNEVKYFNRNGDDPGWKKAPDAYCVEQLVPASNQNGNEDTCPGERDLLIFCEAQPFPGSSVDTEESRILFAYINIVSLGIAMIFLLATAYGFIVFDKQNIHKQSLLLYVFSQFLFYLMIMIIYMNQLWKFLATPLCTPVGILAHFFGISTFAWLSVINFDLWWTFRKLSTPTEMNWGRFGCYTMFSFTIPVLVIGAGLFLQYFRPNADVQCRMDVDDSPYPNPDYGVENCFLSNRAQFLYFYSPVGFLLLMNIVFYSCTSYRLCSFYKTSQRLAAKKHRNSCQLLLKLFFVTGTIWTFQVLHAVIEHDKRTWYWSVVDVLSMLQSIAIFIIFICKKENWRTMTKKYPILQGVCCVPGMSRLEGTSGTSASSRDGSTRLSRAEGSQRKSNLGVPQYQVPSEIIQLP